MADPEKGTSKQDLLKRGTSTTSRGTKDRALDRQIMIPQVKTPMTTDVAPPTKPMSPTGVWAYRIGKALPNPADGWPHVVKIRNFKDLISHLERARLVGNVSKLAIVAHGDSAGLVQMDRNVSPDNVELFADDFGKLATFLTKNGKLMFMACQAGLANEGTHLLKKISSYLNPDQVVVGFSINGFWVGESSPGLAGNIFEAPKSMRGMPLKEYKGSKRMTEDSVFAKWAQDGRIIRLPLQEEISTLRGSWQVVTAKRSSKNVNRLRQATLKYSSVYPYAEDIIELVAKNNNTIWAGTYKYGLTDQTRGVDNPKTIDILYTTGKDKGKLALGIFRFGKADYASLTLCLAEPLKDRPKAFTTPVKSGRLLLELRRQVSP